MLEKTEWPIMDVQSRDTSNIVYKTENEVKQTRHAAQKAKMDGNTIPQNNGALTNVLSEGNQCIYPAALLIVKPGISLVRGRGNKKL